MSLNVKIKRGVNIKLKGTAEKVNAEVPLPETFAIKPTDFHGLSPKLSVKVGDEVTAGSPLFYDKYNDKIKFTAPVSGEIVEINRGEKRKLLEIKILADKETKYSTFDTGDIASLSKEKAIELMLESGLWPFIRQRPFDVIANPNDQPKAIFISAFDSSPLAPDMDFIVHGNGELFQAGLDVVSKLTSGKVHLNVHSDITKASEFLQAKGVQINTMSGPHPSGNVGVQIHHIDPLNKGEAVWYLRPHDVLTIGRFFKEGKLDAARVVALSGSGVSKPRYFKSMIGASVKTILDGNVEEGDLRYISGNVLTGTQISPEGYLGFYDNHVSVIPEGKEPQFLGWLAPGFDKFSLSRTFFSWLMPGKTYDLDTNMNGEHRAFVMTGQYEKVFPFNIYPVQLIKSIMIQDIEQMENLGIYEVAPEDFALCEYACTSKMELQTIVRDGLDVIKKEFA